MRDPLDVPDWAYCGECGVSHLHRTPICGDTVTELDDNDDDGDVVEDEEEFLGFLAGDFASDAELLGFLGF
jgi:hypothetical protein